jgi:glutathione S-transferase
MALTLYYHPLSSFCHKVLIALYEAGTPFTPHLVDLADEAQRNAFYAQWPIGRFPVLGDEARGRLIPESSIIIEHLELHHPGPAPLIPAEADEALRVRLWDRFFDAYVMAQVQKIVGDRLRDADHKDPQGVAESRGVLQTALNLAEAELTGRTWAAGETFGLVDCAAAPALYYADLVAPLAPSHPNLGGYMERMKQRPSYARVLAEAAPYLHMFPRE